jgi:glycine/D-amino acid oxidase-like deaminating enzyme
VRPTNPWRLPASLWTATATPASEYPPLEGEHRAEACIVGGGFTGLSAALHLAELGADTVLLEAGEPGFGASGRNGGQVIPGLRIDPDELEARFGPDRGARLTELVGRAADFVFDLVRRHAIECEARQDGWIKAAHSEPALRATLRSAAQWCRRGAPLTELDRVQVAEITGTEAYLGGWVDHRGGVLQPLSYARGLARVARTAGARIHGTTLVTGLHRSGSGWTVRTLRGAVIAPQVVIATNAYTDLAGPRGPWPGLAQSVLPVYSYLVASRPVADPLRRTILPKGHAVSDTRRLLRYFRLDSVGRLVMGGLGKFRESSDPADYRAITASARELYPELGNLDWEFVWGGKLALTLDHLPHLHQLGPGVYAGLGYNGRGVAMATLMGKALAERVQGTSDEVLVFPITPLRRVPLHRWRRPILEVAVSWKRALDRLDRVGGPSAPRRPS